MKNLIFFLGLLLGASNAFCQEGLSEQQAAEYTQLSFDLEGTYQIQMIDTRTSPTITLDLFPQIDDLRHPTEIKYLNLNPNMRIMILPEATINDSNFQWIERIAYVNSTDL